MIRYAQKGAVDLAQAKELIESLVVRRYPMIEEVQGRVYFHYENKSARDVALLTLAYRHPQRVHKQELLATIEHHGFKKQNAQMAVRRISGLVDDPGDGNLRILAPGLRTAEEIMKLG